MQVHDALGDRKPEPQPRLAAFAAMETVERMRAIFFGHARAFIFNLDYDRATLRYRAQCDLLTRRRVVNRVRNQIADRALKQGPVCAKRHAVGVHAKRHAGLFGDAFDLYRLGQEWLRPQKLLDPAAVARALTGGRSFALGWRRRAARGSAGPTFSRQAFGQTGFAGGSLWMDPETDRLRVLLASRRDPLADFNAWRRRFHALG